MSARFYMILPPTSRMAMATTRILWLSRITVEITVEIAASRQASTGVRPDFVGTAGSMPL